MSANPGVLNEPVTVQMPGTRASDGQGGGTTPFVNASDDPTTWARIRGVGEREQFRRMTSGAKVTHTIRMRYRTDIKPSWQLLWETSPTTRTLLVMTPPVDPDGLKEFIEFMCSEQVAG